MCGGGQNTVTNQASPPPQVLAAYQNVINQAQNQSRQPLQQYTGNLVSGFTPMQNQAFTNIENANNVANPYINAAAQYASSAGTPIQGMQFQGAGTGGQGLSQMGVNYLNQATQPLNVPQYSANAISQYQSPYTQQVLGATAAQMNNIDAQQNQQLVGNAISKGAWGGDRAGIAQSELANQQDLANNQTLAGIAQQGFQQAQNQFNTQQGLALQQGTTQAQLAANAGQQSLGEFNAQQQAGIGAQEATGWLGSNAASQFGALGQEAQGTALTGASSLLSAGNLQQQLNQEQLNIPYEQFLQQQSFPYQQLGWLAGVTEGTGSQMGGTSSSTSPAPSQLASYVGAAGSVLGGLGLAGVFANRGGRIPRHGFADGGVPDVSLSIIPEASNAITGRGPPAPPPPMQSGSGSNASNALGGMGMLEQAFGANSPAQMDKALSNADQITMGANAIGMSSMPMSSMAMDTALDMPTITTISEKNGGRIPGYAGGGVTSFNNGSRNISIPQLDTSGMDSVAGSRGISIPQQGYSMPTNQEPSLASTSNYAPPPVSQAPHSTYYRPGTGPVSTQNGTATNGYNPNTKTYTYTINGQTYNIPSMFVNGANWALARGGRAGFDQGGVIQQAGFASAGDPLGMGNPMYQRQGQQFAQLPDEKLQELTMRAGPQSPQGRVLRNIIQQRHMQPAMQANSAQQPNMLAPPRAPVAGFQPQGGMFAFGGRAGFADGGEPDWVDRMRTAMAVTRPVGSVAYEPTDVDDVAAPAEFTGRDGFIPVSASQTAPLSAQNTAALAPQGALPQMPIAHKQAGFQPGAIPAVDDTQPATSDDVESPDVPERNQPQSLGNRINPWLALIQAGGAMMASRSPFFGNALGEGVQAGVKNVGEQVKEADERDYRQGEITMRGKEMDTQMKRLEAEIQHWQDSNNRETQRDLNTKLFHDEDMKLREQGLGIEQENSNLRQSELNKTEYVGQQAGPDGKPVGIYRNPYTGAITNGPVQQKQEPAQIATAQALIDRGVAPDFQTAWKLVLSGHANPAAFNTAVQHELGLMEKDPEYAGMPKDQREQAAEQNVINRGVARQSGYGQAPAAAPSTEPVGVAPQGAAPQQPPSVPQLPPRPASVPAGAAYSPSRRMWKAGDQLYDAAGNPVNG